MNRFAYFCQKYLWGFVYPYDSEYDKQLSFIIDNHDHAKLVMQEIQLGWSGNVLRVDICDIHSYGVARGLSAGFRPSFKVMKKLSELERELHLRNKREAKDAIWNNLLSP